MNANVWSVVVFCATLYFGAQAFTGENGLMEWSDRQEREAELIKVRDDLSAEVARLTDEIERLTGSVIDDDFLEELARAQSLSASDERMTHLVPFPPAQKERRNPAEQLYAQAP